ncbi:hypothetical protein CMV_030212 [Castanea mollissima]|uniref:Uncharacterized protein n=1 Tax=Castanea mollissima TaxID=60419 RepID=A0A8J4Q3N8_9ROSI|nr:hypothetical protein CMV_030212 [Castanea mollissima]
MSETSSLYPTVQLPHRSSSDWSSSVQSTSVLRSINKIGAPTFFVLPLFSASVLPLFSVIHQIVDAAHCSSSDQSSSVQSTVVLRSIDQIWAPMFSLPTNQSHRATHHCQVRRLHLSPAPPLLLDDSTSIVVDSSTDSQENFIHFHLHIETNRA